MVVKHSPGPWTARGLKSDTVYVGKGVISGQPDKGLTPEVIHPHVVRIYRDDEGRRCTQFIADCRGATCPNAENASLIAKSPEMFEALAAIADFPEMASAYAYCEKYGIKHNQLEPPYLTMARIADSVISTKGAEMKPKYDDKTLPTVSGGKDGNPPDRYEAVYITGNAANDLAAINAKADEGYRFVAAVSNFVLMGNYKENK